MKRRHELLVQRRGVEQRRDDERHLVPGEVHVDERVGRVPRDVAVRHHDALGVAGRAGRVLDHVEVVQPDLQVERVVRAHRPHVVERELALGAVHGDQPGQSAARRLRRHRPAGQQAGQTGRSWGQRGVGDTGQDLVDGGTERLVPDQDARAAVHDDVRPLGRHQPGVQRQVDRARLGGREHRLDERRRVEAEVGDPVAALHAERPQPVCQAVRPGGELGIRRRHLTVDEGHLVGGHPLPPDRPGPNAEVVHAASNSDVPRAHRTLVDRLPDAQGLRGLSPGFAHSGALPLPGSGSWVRSTVSPSIPRFESASAVRLRSRGTQSKRTEPPAAPDLRAQPGRVAKPAAACPRA